MSTDPSASPARTSRRSWPVTRLVKSSTRRGRSPNRLSPSTTTSPSSNAFTPLPCCSARTSVGAMRAPWWPPDTALSSAATATIVFPAPTSPCKSRCIGWGDAMSVAISSMARRCAAVNGNGSAPTKRSTSSLPTTCSMPCEVRSSSRFRRTSSTCTRSNSSKASRRRAAVASAIESGPCIDFSASKRPISPSRS